MAPGVQVVEEMTPRRRRRSRDETTETGAKKKMETEDVSAEVLCSRLLLGSNLNESKVLQDWQDLSEEQLRELVKKYEAATKKVQGVLKERGIAFDVSLVDLKAIQLGVKDDNEVLGNVDDLDPSQWQVPNQCIPVHANVTEFNWKSLYEVEQFDVIMMDPPWQLATHNPTRGVALGYSQLTDAHIMNLPVKKLQKEGGLLFVWVINAKYKFTLDLFKEWGYEMVDEIVWVKLTVNRRLAKSHGFYLQHAKEVCLVARKKGKEDPEGTKTNIASDIIFSERRGQSQKPEEIYEIIEELVPNGKYLEIFGRKNNLRDYWVTVGNEVTGNQL